MDDVQKDKARNLLWDFYEVSWGNISNRCWGEVYAKAHKELIDEVNAYANTFDIKLDQNKFRSVERDFV